MSAGAAARRGAPDYGLDAPGVVRNLLVCGGLGLALAAAAFSGLLPRVVAVGPVAGVSLSFPLGTIGLWAGAGCAAMGLWMIWSSRVGKVTRREWLLDRIAWTGGERVLDVGCGRGLMGIGAAKRLTTGTAIGIDLWHAEDLSGNRPDAALANARLEGVADRFSVRTADMREIPFPDAAFDVVVSCEAIHNIPSADGRARAIAEIARVLKPGAQAVIEDIRHHREYASVFAAHGCPDARQIGSHAAMILLAAITMGSLRPATLLVRKAA